MKPLLVLTMLLLCLLQPIAGKAADRPEKIKPWSVRASKSRDREKLFTEWMTGPELDKLAASKRASNSGQIIFFEYSSEKRKFRAIFTDQVPPGPSGWTTTYGEEALAKEVARRKGLGQELLYLTLQRPERYEMVFLPTDKIPVGRRILESLGVEAPGGK
ncbi:MAG TPA: hypothetical protein VD994_10210 [Prosthecobacter sp.]|nr:hypothetical protein [Prosthecobacter sp.]